MSGLVTNDFKVVLLIYQIHCQQYWWCDYFLYRFTVSITSFILSGVVIFNYIFSIIENYFDNDTIILFQDILEILKQNRYCSF